MTQEQFNELLPNRSLSGKEGYQLIINRLDYGFTVEYGCKKLAIESVEKLQELMNFYYMNPDSLYHLWHNSSEKEKMILHDRPDVMIDAGN